MRLVRSSSRHDLVRLGDAGGWWIPRTTAEAPGVAYSAPSGGDLSFELALYRSGHHVVVFDPSGETAAGLRRLAADPARLELVTGGESGGETPPAVVQLFDTRPHRWVNLIRLRVAPDEHRLLGSLLRGGPRPAVLCAEFEPPASVARTTLTVLRWRLAGYSLARVEGSRYTFVPRATLAQALRRRTRRLLRQARPAAIVRGNPSVKRNALALTFDDGPSEWTAPILDVLRAAGARATFFVVGESIAGREGILRRISAEGHEVGNHSFSHPRLDDLEPDEVRSELRRTNDAIAQELGTPPRLFRPPYFADSDAVREVAGALGLELSVYAPVWTPDWTSDSSDDEIYRAIRDAVYPGSIVVLHDGCPPRTPPDEALRPDRQPTVDAVRRLVPALLERGYELVTVSELLALE